MLSEEPLRPQRSHSFIARNTSARVTRSQATMYSFSRIVMACISGSTIGKPWPVRPASALACYFGFWRGSSFGSMYVSTHGPILLS
jgi:hypothetical protein